jgi:competence protein ComEC
MRRSFYILTCAFAVGILWRSLFDVSSRFLIASVVCGVLALGFLALIRQTSVALYGTLALLACVLGVVRTERAFFSFEEGRVWRDGERVSFNAVVVSEKEQREKNALLTLVVEDGAQTRVRAFVERNTPLEYGDKVSFRGSVRIPKEFENEYGRVFNYERFCMAQGIHYEAHFPSLAQREGNDGLLLFRALFFIKHLWHDGVARVLPEPHASLAEGITVGAKQSLGDEWYEIFRITGLTHIIVLSGFNLTIVACGIMVLFRRFAFAGVVVGSCGVVCFAFMAGLSATVVRASVMAIVGLFALHAKRPQTATRLLFLAGFGMLVWNPFLLCFDIGFQLSFLATEGLIGIAPFFEKVFSWVSERWALRAILSATCAAQVATFPLIAWYMGSLSLVAPLTNLLVLPVVPFAMGSTFLAGVVGAFSPALAYPFALSAFLPLAWILDVASFFAKTPFASVGVF